MELLELIFKKTSKTRVSVSSMLLVDYSSCWQNNIFAPLCPLNFIQLSGLDVLVENTTRCRGFSVALDLVNRLPCSRKKPAIQDEVALFTLSLNTCCSINKLRCIGCFSFHIRMKNHQQLNNIWGFADVVCVWSGWFGWRETVLSLLFCECSDWVFPTGSPSFILQQLLREKRADVDCKRRKLFFLRWFYKVR